MSEVFFIGDTHFGHALMLQAYPGIRPGANVHEHDEALIERWNARVTDADIIWHLGDFALKVQESYIASVARRLKGDKRLVLGNHDNWSKCDYSRFFKCFGAVKFQREYILTHIPVAAEQFNRFAANIHGHTHAANLADPRYWNVSCEQINCTPISFDELRAKHSSAH